MVLRSTTPLRTLADSIRTWVLLAGNISYVRWDLVMPPQFLKKDHRQQIVQRTQRCSGQKFSRKGGI